MTVKEGERTYIGSDKTAKLNPGVTTNQNNGQPILNKNNIVIEPWDLMWGEFNLSATIAKLQKALDKKNGIEVKEYDPEEMCYMHIHD